MANRFQDINIIDIDQEHMLGRVHSFENCSALDGPGLRVTIFLQGCQFRCKYCHNRDSWDLNAGTLYSVAEVVEKVLPFASFLKSSNGGVTVSGGEALLQAEFLTLLFRQFKKLGIHTCLDTNGYVRNQLWGEKLDALMEVTDHVLLDIKQMNNAKHIDLVEVPNTYTLRFAKHLAEINKTTWIRYVLVPGYTDDGDSLRQLGEFLAPMKNVKKVDILPYHRIGKTKWAEMGLDYPLGNLEPPTRESIEWVVGMLKGYGLNVKSS
ncbi:pyruvate formate-lyase-activating protein [Agaribacterium haliotis]|uniref:pyruvate formate-lyase-activating protein n=1 Tax=Agaribacterium haliotis TaxID=2013869 RepID=UPI000BB578E5|nr:pyruvate formate-lyase-activating protein [Agaribacterium haliotis]